ncbi:MAG: hypothetical protein K6F33_15025 [Bacteroidales bacterium]|nr:hypothetical protein [Bacteroidales bacterium]
MKKILYITAAASLIFGFSSCTDDDGNPYPGGDGPVSVSKVYLLDNSADEDEGEVREREVEFARLGQTLRLEGSGFGGTTQILVNGYETYFNTALATDKSIIFSLSSTTPVVDADESVRNKIQFVKSSGTYSYDFTIRAASPRISAISPALPKAGETVKVSGVNLEETSEIVLPGDIKITEGITNAPEEETGEWFTFTMPEGVTEGGSITMTGANGQAISGAYFNDTKGMLLDFDDNGVHSFWSWSKTGSMIDDKDLVDDPLGLYGKVCQIIPQRLLDMEGQIPGGKSRATEVWTGGSGDTKYEDVSWIAANYADGMDTPLADVAFQFEINVPEEWNLTGQIEIVLGNNYNFTGYGTDEVKSASALVYAYVPWLNSDGTTTAFKTDGWQTITIPLTEFTKYKLEVEDSKTPLFSEFVEDHAAFKYPNFGMGFVNGDVKVSEDVVYKADVCKQKIYVDNFRIVHIKSVTVSDY